MSQLITISDVINTIAGHYSPLSEECKADLEAVAKLYSVDKGTHLVQEGEFADKTYFIVKGCARAYYLKDGKDISDWFAFEYDFISAINSFF